MIHLSKKIFPTILFIFCCFSQAHAFDQGQFLVQLKQLIESDGSTFNYENMETSDSGDIIFNDVTIENKAKKHLTTAKKVILVEPSQIGDSRFQISGTDAIDVMSEISGSTLTANRILGEGLIFSLPQAEEAGFYEIGKLRYETITIKKTESTSDNILTIPFVEAKGIEYKNGGSYSLSSFVIAPFESELVGKTGDEAFVNFDGMSMQDFTFDLTTFNFSLKSIDFGALKIASESKETHVDFSIEGMQLKNYSFALLPDPNQPAISDHDSSGSMGKMDVLIDGKRAFGLDVATYSMSGDEETKRADYKGEVKGLWFDLNTFPKKNPNDPTLKNLKKVGMDVFNMNISWNGALDLESGILDVSKMRYEIVDQASTDLTMKIGGFSEHIIRSLGKLITQINTTQDREQQTAMALQAVSLLAPLSIKNMSWSIEDSGLLEKVLAVQAEQQGQNPDALRASVSTLVAIGLAPLNLPEFSKHLSQSVDTFMQGGKTITATIAPSGGVNFLELMAMGQGIQAGNITPAEYLDRLQLEVSAE